ncbi:hypothetical protein TTY48_17930 [Tsukamurella sp. TY48]|nr:hypothetical protein TTY48_17930 [Tsukamurella sp. TY48]
MLDIVPAVDEVVAVAIPEEPGAPSLLLSLPHPATRPITRPAAAIAADPVRIFLSIIGTPSVDLTGHEIFDAERDPDWNKQNRETDRSTDGTPNSLENQESAPVDVGDRFSAVA